MIDDHDVNVMAAMGVPFSTGGSSSRASERGQL